jgi:isocitrate lyase
METAKPIIEEAREFAHGVKAAFPHQMLAYNLSPSFNWDGVSAYLFIPAQCSTQLL